MMPRGQFDAGLWWWLLHLVKQRSGLWRPMSVQPPTSAEGSAVVGKFDASTSCVATVWLLPYHWESRLRPWPKCEPTIISTYVQTNADFLPVNDTRTLKSNFMSVF
ncbi:hypothetical protein MRX96_029879 [Rhipicephalus microplus]